MKQFISNIADNPEKNKLLFPIKDITQERVAGVMGIRRVFHNYEG